MCAKVNLLIHIAMCSILIIPPLNAYADECADIMNKAGDIFDNASSSSKAENYDEAIRLYEEAAEYYQEASELQNCRCPKTGTTAINNIRISKENADSNRKKLEHKASYEAELKVYETYNVAKEKFNMGNSGSI